jgi:hypothetical protein
MGYVDKSQGFFWRALSPRQRRQKRRQPSAGGKTELLMGKPNSISDFLQQLSPQPFPSKASIQRRAAGLFSATEVDFKS